MTELNSMIDLQKTQNALQEITEKLFPLCRSITGGGFRKSLEMMKDYIPLSVHEVPSGTEVFDWTVPKEWNIKDAYVKDSHGNRVIDFQKSNLHVVGYSMPISKKCTLEELKEHLHSLPEHPDWIPYRTSYYNENWGFCIAHNELNKLESGNYEVVIDSTLEDGSLTYGEYVIQGESDEEVLLSCHACHPSLANDNVAGMALISVLGQYLSTLSLRYSYRFLVIPGTIGAITWLARNRNTAVRIKHGLVITCVGDRGALTYKKSRIGKAEIDRAVEHVLTHSGEDYSVIDYSPYGYDERQYCSPGFNLPVGCLQRTPHGEYPEYHTSADNLQFISIDHLMDSYETYVKVVDVLEGNRHYLNTSPYCEPQLGKRGLYTTVGGKSNTIDTQMALLWVLNLSDGSNALLDIAERAGIEFRYILQAAESAKNKGLLIEKK